MNRSQLLIIIGAILVVVLLFQLPRQVVENDQLQEVSKAEQHSFEMPVEVQAQLLELRSALKSENNFDKKANFADALARVYLDYGVLDSAVSYAEMINGWFSEPSLQVAEIYFKAFERSSSSEKGISYAQRAREILQILSDKDPEDLFLKNRLAMTLVASENPMSGINMLREIVSQDEDNRQALLSLGLLSIQSGQFDRAKERFEKLISLDPLDHESKLYLAVSMMETNQQSQARLLLEEILSTQDSIPAIKLMANDYLESL